MMMNTTISMAP